jgi:phosphotransferase system IIB component
MCDSASDSAGIEEEIIYVRFMLDGKPTIKFISLKPLAKADAAGIKSAIVESLEVDANQTLGKWKNRLVGFGADGAAVMMGHLGGVAAKLKEEAPHIIEMHCCAHRLELAVKDAAKADSFLQSMDEFLEDLYKLYHYSPVCWHGLQEAGQALGVSVVKPVNVFGTRWLPHRERAIKAVERNWKALVTHLEQVALEDGRSERKNKAQGFLRQLVSVKFLLYMNFTVKFYDIMTSLSLTFQQQTSTIETAFTKTNSTIEMLEKLSRSSKLSKLLIKGMSEDFMKYQAVVLDRHSFLTGCDTRATRLRGAYDSDSIVQQAKEKITRLLAITIRSLKDRFQSFQDNPVISASRIFEVRLWPQNVESLSTYGDDQISILAEHFKYVLDEAGLNATSAETEWHGLKDFVRRKVLAEQGLSLGVSSLWESILQTANEEFRNILGLVEIVLLFPIHTAECERGFSMMKRVKSDWRSRLKPSTLNDLLTVQLSGITMRSFVPDRAIGLWWQSSGGHGRRPDAQPHGPHPRRQHSVEHDDSDSETESD